MKKLLFLTFMLFGIWLNIGAQGEKLSISVEPESLTIPAGGGEGTVTVKTNGTVSDPIDIKDKDDNSVTWLTVTLNEDGTYKVVAEAYDGTEDRTAYVIFRMKEDSEKTATLTVTQKGVEIPADIFFVEDPSWIMKLELKDINNTDRTDDIRGIRSGNTLKLPENKNPEMKHKEKTWEFKWILGNDEFDVNDQISPVAKSVTKKIISCQARYDENMDWQTVGEQREITIYPKPVPTEQLSFVQKGNGTSKTWIIKGKPTSGENIRVGNDQGMVYEITSNDLSRGWFTLDVQNVNDIFLYIVHDYGNGIVITSDKYLKSNNINTNCEVVSWDGSSYDGKNDSFTRSGDPTGIENVVNIESEDVTDVFSVNGTKTTLSNHGLNIVRMKDGSVRKVFVK